MLAPRYMRSRTRLDRLIKIQRRSSATNAMNEPLDEWADLFDTRAKAYPTPGFERSISDQNVATQPMTFEVRPEARTLAILPSDRIITISDGQAYNIVAPIAQPERGGNVTILTAADRT